MSKSSVGYRLSFLELFEVYRYVEIPLIQRDYAQGRQTAGGIRERFLTSLREALQGSSDLSLDFVYGEVVKFREQDCFQPIDGQQRLTTLFLLHWFLDAVAREPGDFRERMKDDGKCRFLYSVRPSSARFLSKLLEYPPLGPRDHAAKLVRGPDLVANIKDQAWFFREWLQDQTIVGALAMIEAMRTEFAALRDVNTYYNRLKDSNQPRITMDVLDLGSLGLSEDIYIKMNARGKSLTGFERFKAWLLRTHERSLHWPEPGNDTTEWPVLLDGDWLDLFWSFHADKPRPAESVSEVYFRTIIALAVSSHALMDDVVDRLKDWSKADADDQEDLWKELFTPEHLKEVFQHLRYLSTRDRNDNWPIVALRSRLDTENAGPFDKKRLAEAFFEGKSEDVTSEDVTLKMRLWLYAVCLFSSWREQMSDSGSSRWLRVVRNLLANTEIEAKNFSNCMKSLKQLGDAAAAANWSVRTAFDGERGLVGLDTGQVAEEQRKADLIELSRFASEWETVIKQAEAHAILRGQIELLLPEDDDLQTFKRRWEIFQQLLDGDGSRVGKREYLLTRAVLACSGTFSLGWQKKMTFRDNQSSWVALLNRKCDFPAFRTGMLSLIDSMRDPGDLDKALREILRCPQAGEPWMRDIVRWGGRLFDESITKTKKVQNYYNNGVFIFFKQNANDCDILLGSDADLRNQLVEWLVAKNGWAFASGVMDERRLVCNDRQMQKVFFRGHHLKLVKAMPANNEMFCRFEYKRVLVGESSNNDPPVEIPYPVEAGLEVFRDSLLEANHLHQHNVPVAAVLAEVILACRSAPRFIRQLQWWKPPSTHS